MALALKYSRAPDITAHLLDILEVAASVALEKHGMEFVQLLLYYLLNVGTIKDVDAFMRESNRRLSGSVKGATMTAAEMLILKGKEEGEKAGRKKGEIELLMRLISKRFGASPEWVVLRLQQAEPQQLEAWAERLLDVSNLEELFENR